jgi:hypothetical protein
MLKITYKEYSINTRIKAIYILEEKKLTGKILEIIKVFRTRAYTLAIVIKECK